MEKWEGTTDFWMIQRGSYRFFHDLKGGGYRFLLGRKGGATDFSFSKRGGYRFFDFSLNFSIAPPTSYKCAFP